MNDRKPIIGIVGKVHPKYNEDLWHRIDECDEIRYLIVKHGGNAIMLLPTEPTMIFNNNDIRDEKKLSKQELEDLYNQIKLCDGIILQGGLYSCNYEIEIAKKAIELNIPVIGICAGFNNILRALGSEVLLDKDKKHDIYDINYRHEISIEKDTELYKLINKEKIRVNSIHSMIATKEMVKKVAKISSYSYDGLVESFEVPNKKFVIGIKWHPELMIQEEYVDRIMEKFINLCK